jgi:hypothetical protein
MKGQPLLTRFEEKIDKISSTNKCWIWTSAIANGYGVFWIHGRNQSAHRLAWLFYCGDIPDGWFVCHHCDNKLCVNPQHLFVGTAMDNSRDCVMKGRRHNQDGDKNPAAKLTAKDIVRIRDMRAAGMFQKLIAEQFGVGREAIGKILRGERWNTVEA